MPDESKKIFTYGAAQADLLTKLQNFSNREHPVSSVADTLKELNEYRAEFSKGKALARANVPSYFSLKRVSVLTKSQRDARQDYLAEYSQGKQFNEHRVELLKALHVLERQQERQLFSKVKDEMKFKNYKDISRNEKNALKKPVRIAGSIFKSSRVNKKQTRNQDFTSLQERNEKARILSEELTKMEARARFIDQSRKLERNIKKANPSMATKAAYIFRREKLDRKIKAAEESAIQNINSISGAAKILGVNAVEENYNRKFTESTADYFERIRGLVRGNVLIATGKLSAAPTPTPTPATPTPAAATPAAATPAAATPAAPTPAAPTAAPPAAPTAAPTAAVPKAAPKPPPPPPPYNKEKPPAAAADANAPKLYVINGHGGKIAKTVQTNGRIITPGNPADNYTLAFQDQYRHLEEVAREGKLWPLDGGNQWQVNQGAISDIKIGPLEGKQFKLTDFLSGLNAGQAHRWSKLTNPPHDVVAAGALALRQTDNTIVLKQGDELRAYLQQNPEDRDKLGTPIFFCDQALGKIKPMGDTSLSEIMRGMEKVAGPSVPLVVATCGVTGEPGYKKVAVRTDQAAVEMQLAAPVQVNAAQPVAPKPPDRTLRGENYKEPSPPTPPLRDDMEAPTSHFFKQLPLPEITPPSPIPPAPAINSAVTAASRPQRSQETLRAMEDSAAMMAEMHKEADVSRSKRNPNYVDEKSVDSRLKNTISAIDKLISHVKQMQSGQAAKKDPLNKILSDLHAGLIEMKKDTGQPGFLVVNMPAGARDKLDRIDLDVNAAIIKAAVAAEQSGGKNKLSDRVSPFKALIKSYEKDSQAKQPNQEVRQDVRPR